MDFDTLLLRFFGTEEIGALPPDRLLAGVEHARLQFGLEKDRGRRFALWSLLYMLGAAPDVDDAFAEAEDRDAAREFMDMTDAEMADEDDEPDEA